VIEGLPEIDQGICFDAGAPFANIAHLGKLSPGHGTVKRAPRNHCVVRTPDGEAVLRFTPHTPHPNGYQAPVHTSLFPSPEEAAEVHALHLAKLEELRVLRLPTVVRAGTSSLLGSGIFVLTHRLPPGSRDVSSSELSAIDSGREAYNEWAQTNGLGYRLKDLDGPEQFARLPGGGLVTYVDTEPVYEEV
jgi:hypothetical protein